MSRRNSGYFVSHPVNVIYLIDDVAGVSLMKDPDAFQIRMHLKNCTRTELYANHSIPVFSEDDEAREFLRAIFDSIFKDSDLSHLKSHFHLVEAKIGANHIKSIFADKALPLSQIAFAVLDGDKGADLSKNLLSLPGGAAPEKVLVNYATSIIEDQGGFWDTSVARTNGFTRAYFVDRVKNKWDSVEQKIEEARSKLETTTGIRREHAKKIWSEFREFLLALLSYWVEDERNVDCINQFKMDLRTMYKKTALNNGLNPNDWR